jgi:DNA-binding NtrC family response regulator
MIDEVLACLSSVQERLRSEAVLRGAYDVISLRAPDAATQLAARLMELAAPQPTVPQTDTMVTRSEVSQHLLAQIARVAATSMPVC